MLSIKAVYKTTFAVYYFSYSSCMHVRPCSVNVESSHLRETSYYHLYTIFQNHVDKGWLRLVMLNASRGGTSPCPIPGVTLAFAQ